MMETRRPAELTSYPERLAAYTDDELEDIYFNIDILKHSRRYRVLINEMERRGIRPQSAPLPEHRSNLRDWLDSRPILAGRRTLRAVLFSVILFLATASATFAMLSPIWLFAIPLKFLNLQTAFVYFACAPVPPILAAGLGGRLGGRGVYAIWVLLGVVAGMAAFNLTGAPTAIIESIMKHEAGGGFSMGGF
jgi:hypothetical protein